MLKILLARLTKQYLLYALQKVVNDVVYFKSIAFKVW